MSKSEKKKQRYQPDISTPSPYDAGTTPFAQEMREIKNQARKREGMLLAVLRKIKEKRT